MPTLECGAFSLLLDTKPQRQTDMTNTMSRDESSDVAQWLKDSRRRQQPIRQPIALIRGLERYQGKFLSSFKKKRGCIGQAIAQITVMAWQANAVL